MLASEIKNLLLPFSKNTDRSSSILFDGVWGCGKTYQINKFVKSYPDLPITYVSLFGIDDCDSLVLRLVERLDAQDILNVGGRFFLREALVPQPYNGMVIVFDDIERKGRLLTFEVLLGVLNNLINLGFKVVGVVDSKQVATKERDSFAALKEKVFERYIAVTASFENRDGLTDICNESHLRLADNNWRLLLKSEKHFSKILEEAREKGKQDFLERMGINESQLLSYIVFACKCVFSNDSEAPVFKDDVMGSIRKDRYERFSREFGAYTANALFKGFAEDGVVNKREIVEILIECMVRNSYQPILDYHLPSESNSILRCDPFDKYPFYLSDESKSFYLSEFFRRIDEFDFKDRNQMSLLSQVISTFLGKMNDEQLNALAERIVQTTDYSDFGDFLWKAHILNPPKTDAFERFREIYVKKRSEQQASDLDNQIQRLLDTKDYYGLCNLIAERNHDGKKDLLLSKLRERDYLLPDLSGDISDVWDYCHSVCNLISGNPEDCSKMKDLFREQCLKSSSESLRERCQFLCDRYLGGGIDFAKLRATGDE